MYRVTLTHPASPDKPLVYTMDRIALEEQLADSIGSMDVGVTIAVERLA